MDNTEIYKCLKSLEENHDKKFKNDRNYINRCKSYKGLSPKDFKIDPHHTLDEYFAKYGKKLQKGKTLVYKKDELWLMDLDVKYWKIENESSFVYFALPHVNKKKIFTPLITLLAAGAIAGGITAGVLYYLKGPAPEPPLHEHWYEYTNEEKWWEHCSNEGIEAATEDDIGKTMKVTLNGKEHEVRLIGIDHDDKFSGGKAHCTFEFVNVITKDDDTTYTTTWNNKSLSSSDNHNFITTSDLNNTLQAGGKIYKMFLTDAPELLNAMVEVTKYVGTKTTSYSATPYITKLFPLAHDEINNQQHQQVTDNEGATYTYYQNHSTADDRIKKAVNSENGEGYWLRSPNLPYPGVDMLETKAFSVIGSGIITNSSICYSQTYAVAPAFCI